MKTLESLAKEYAEKKLLIPQLAQELEKIGSSYKEFLALNKK